MRVAHLTMDSGLLNAALREVQSASQSSGSAQQLQQQEQAEAALGPCPDVQAPARQSVSPDELREALSELEKGQTPIEFELSEMHDAAEVWIMLLLCIAQSCCSACVC